MSSCIALLEALLINVNPYLSRNKQCAARQVHHQKVLSQESDFRCAWRATRSFTAVSLNRRFAQSPVDALIGIKVHADVIEDLPYLYALGNERDPAYLCAAHRAGAKNPRHPRLQRTRRFVSGTDNRPMRYFLLNAVLSGFP